MPRRQQRVGTFRETRSPALRGWLFLPLAHHLRGSSCVHTGPGAGTRLHAQLDRRRQPRAPLLCPEDGRRSRCQHRHRIRAGSRRYRRPGAGASQLGLADAEVQSLPDATSSCHPPPRALNSETVACRRSDLIWTSWSRAWNNVRCASSTVRRSTAPAR
jgi:hypothetical protein